MPANLLWVESAPKSPEREQEFDAWYNNFHLRQMLHVPGIVAATRYKLSHLQMEWFPPAATTPAWPFGLDHTHVALYELDPACAISEILEALRDSAKDRLSYDPSNEPVRWGRHWFYEAFTEREKSVWLRPDGVEPVRSDGRPNHIFIVPISPLSPDLEDEFNRWYISQGNIRRDGFAAGVRYKLSRVQGSLDSRQDASPGDWPFGYHSYLMIYELHDLLAAYNDLRASVTRSARPQGSGRPSWMASWGSLRKVDHHIVYEPITNRVTPAWIR